ncbi:hemerythrin HHE cation binding domain-containing protein [Exophiala viscosa]|uniref:hemerythrin HHE cation binding domain-containing protein n=1 Tax=Exophiala viscosa TaxID=2486360 RepID=UPI00219D0F49|nr:hemerythrin HHE cation binding domain-containing protein [Exophiala viscosa]
MQARTLHSFRARCLPHDTIRLVGCSRAQVIASFRLQQQQHQHRLPYSTSHEQTPISSDTISGIHGGAVSGAIKHDHAELKEYYHKIMQSVDKDTQTRYQNQFTWELARHSIGEELVVYPALEQYVEGGKEMAEHDRAEHREVKELLYEFQNMSASDPEFKPTLQRLWATLGKHIEEEESDDLPKLEKALPPGESDSMARSFARTKMFVPTRSHPSAPDRPPFETVAGLMAAPIDRLGDLFRKFPKDKD